MSHVSLGRFSLGVFSHTIFRYSISWGKKKKKSVRMNFPVIRMINECVRILWLVTGVLGCTFGISNLKTEDYGCITERD